ncbi:predicted protein [Histoplasma mississippiense (nom. inval.)]|uniref:predicted protein n=1 Tax=Ajellomyces capsulatus (strain NAm1 / WU24) TaxID=2059318 RepID=UPI000157B672|nr:predicted protein [Histoplasma mississippiense (nom. inval.)]EDN02915.1 predicted protein [Histoplasma mississippiense (nom. inval.)]
MCRTTLCGILFVLPSILPIVAWFVPSVEPDPPKKVSVSYRLFFLFYPFPPQYPPVSTP